MIYPTRFQEMSYEDPKIVACKQLPLTQICNGSGKMVHYNECLT